MSTTGGTVKLVTGHVVWIAAGLFSSAFGYELVVRDVGVSLAYLPASFDYSVSGDGFDASGSDGFDSGIGVSFRGLYSFTNAGQRHGLIAEFSGDLAQYTYDSSGGMFSIGATGGVGYGFALMDRWDLHGLVRLGLGVTTLSFDQTESTPEFGADGGYFRYGLAIGASYLISDRWVIRGEIGYDLTSTLLSGDDGVDVDLDLTTPSIAIALYWRLTNMPWRLE